MEYPQDKINELENSKNKGIRDLYGGIHKFNKGYQLYLVKDVKGNKPICKFPKYFV
jgi:hypothetical protein